MTQQAFYFVEKYPKPGQLVFFFYCSLENAERKPGTGTPCRYIGDGILINAALQEMEIDAGAAWEGFDGGLQPAKFIQ